MKQLLFLIIVVLAISFTSCTENYSNGERIGMVTQFSEKGWMWKSWEGSLNLTQTGMNSSGAEPFLFSIDNDQNETEPLRLTLDSAAQYGWKIKLIYHQTLENKQIKLLLYVMEKDTQEI